MINYELTDQLIELENIQRDRFLYRARGQQATEILEHYEIPKELYVLKKESACEENPERNRRTLVCFNFGLIEEKDKARVIECLFFLGHSPEFIAEAMGEELKFIANALCQVIQENRAKKAAELRANPTKFRLVGV